MKKCNPCGLIKQDDEFHRRVASVDGLAARCKPCQSAYDKARADRPDRVAARKEYQATKEGKARLRKGSSSWRKRNPDKARAHSAVARALRNGDIARLPCERCSVTDGVEAHHDDYTKPLDVMWLCDQHHKQRHKELRAAVNGKKT